MGKEGAPLTKKAISTDLILEDYLVDPVEMLRRDVKEYRLLTYEQELQCGQHIDRGALAQALLDRYQTTIVPEDVHRLQTHVVEGKHARETLILSNQGLCRFAAAKSVHHGVTMGELISEGNIGLVEALDNKAWEWERGERFATYVTWRIRQKTRLVPKNEGKTIRIPTSMFSEYRQYQKVIDEFRRVHGGQKPTNEQVAQLLHVKEGSLEEFIQEKIPLFEQVAVMQPKSFELPLSLNKFDAKGTLEDTLFDPDAPTIETVLVDREEQKNIAALFGVLNEREKQILLLRNGIGSPDGLPCTLEEVGHMFGVTRERVRQIEVKAMKKIHISEQYRRLTVPDDESLEVSAPVSSSSTTKERQGVAPKKDAVQTPWQADRNRKYYQEIPDDVRRSILACCVLLPEHEAAVMNLYFHIDENRNQLGFLTIGPMLQISREYAGTIARQALYRLYGMESMNELRDYVRLYKKAPDLIVEERQSV